MKTATLPSLRVTPEFREAAEAVLKEGETVSMLMESAVRDLVRRRAVRAEFLRRGIESLEEFRRTGEAVPAAQVHDELQRRLDKRRKELLG